MKNNTKVLIEHHRGLKDMSGNEYDALIIRNARITKQALKDELQDYIFSRPESDFADGERKMKNLRYQDKWNKSVYEDVTNNRLIIKDPNVIAHLVSAHDKDKFEYTDDPSKFGKEKHTDNWPGKYGRTIPKNYSGIGRWEWHR